MKRPTRAPCLLIILAPSSKARRTTPSTSIQGAPKSVHAPRQCQNFIHDRVFPADGERIANEAFATDDRAWCAMKGVSALELDRYLDEIEGRDRGRLRSGSYFHQNRRPGAGQLPERKACATSSQSASPAPLNVGRLDKLDRPMIDRWAMPAQ